MSQSIRFLGVAVLAWAGVRAVSLGLVPGTEILAFDLPEKAEATTLPAVQPTQLPPIPPMAANSPPYSPPPAYPGYGYPSYGPFGPAYAGGYPVYVPMPAAAARVSPPVVHYINVPTPMAAPSAPYPYFQPGQPAEPWPETAYAEPVPGPKVTPSFREERVPAAFDRLQLSTWAMLRGTPGLPSLAGTGTLGGSQAGARLLWRFDPHLSASLRSSAPINSRRGGEAALGIRYQPFTSIPVAFTAEQRKAFGQYGAGRNAFAAFVEGGLYGQSMPLNSSLDTYIQAGIVGVKSRDWFVDGQAAVTRPVYKNLSAGFGVWGGTQPGLSRLDVGPRLSLRVGKRMRVHADYRHKLIGNAQPGSGGVVTVAGDF
jgi:hypothetical protein